MTSIAIAIMIAVFGPVAEPRQSGAERQQRIDHLETTVQAAEGVRAVKRLHYSYAHYLDSGNLLQ